jgi:hypothetical protein
VEPPREEKGKVQYSIEGWVTTQTLHSIADNRTVAYLYRRRVGPFASAQGNRTSKHLQESDQVGVVPTCAFELPSR